MIAYKVFINGEYIATTSQEDWAVLTATIVATRKDDTQTSVRDIRCNLGGLSLPNEEDISHHFRWKNINLNVGDKIEIEVVDVSEIDSPVKRYRSDSKVQENPFTDEECREMRYQDYLEYKKEFEPNAT
mgnify:CR=1 FL=1